MDSNELSDWMVREQIKAAQSRPGPQPQPVMRGLA